MEDDFEFASFPCWLVSKCVGDLILFLPLPQNLAYPLAYGACLIPSGVCERGVVWSRGLKMPLLVSSVEAISVSGNKARSVHVDKATPHWNAGRRMAESGLKLKREARLT